MPRPPCRRSRRCPDHVSKPRSWRPPEGVPSEGSAGSAGSADRRWIVLPVLCLSVFLVVVDNTIVNVALPTLNRTLGASITSLQWIVDAYSLAFAGLLLAGGGIGDRLGRKGTMQVGLVFFGLFSARGGLLRLDRHAHRHPGADGPGRCLHLPGQLGHPHERLPGPIRAAEGARDLGRHIGHRRRLRADRRRGAARALLVRVDLLGERADRRRDVDRRRAVDPATAARCASIASTSGASSSRRRGSCCWCWPSSRGRSGAGPRRGRWRASPERRSC